MRIDSTPAPLAAPETESRPAPRSTREAAQQFEALLLGQMLKTMRQAGDGGWLGTGDDQAGATMMEIAEERLAQVLATQGGLGLANLVVEGLERKP